MIGDNDLKEDAIPFGTKAETLAHLSSKVTTAVVLPQICFTVAQWNDSRPAILNEIESNGWFKIPLIVRSSARAEDTVSSSLAGHFCSILDVLGKDAVLEAVGKVIASYESNSPDEQVLLQPLVQHVSLSGVAFSFDPNTGSPYIVINYDDQSASTETVTSGGSAQQKNFYYFKHSPTSHIAGPLQKIISLVYELEGLLKSDCLDIEFAMNKEGILYLLQCRPLKRFSCSQVSVDLQPTLAHIESKIRCLQSVHPYLLGTTSVFGVMPDWNPAEIIGTRPRPLALSLYQELVTDNIWAYQRDNYGYRNLRSFPLVVSFGGQPYVDVRVDFNSFVPGDIDSDLGQRLVNYYLNRLIETPAAHDKVEFDVVYTCYTFDLQERLKSLYKSGFSEADANTLVESLRKLTNRIIHQERGLWLKDLEKVERLRVRQTTINNSNLDTISKLYWLIEDCKRYGTLPFAGLARAAFIAVQMLKSLVAIGVLKKADYDGFMLSLKTVSGKMNQDLGALDRTAFLEKYGHLRPGTYDILSPRYDEDPELYFDWSKDNSIEKNEHADYALSDEQVKRIEDLLKEHQLEHDVKGLFDFFRVAIEGREMSKFVFTKSLSDALTLFKQLGEEWGFSADDCSYANISCIKSLYGSSADIAETLSKSIESGKQSYAETRSLKLPPLVVEPTDIWSFQLPDTEPNFITQKSVISRVAQLPCDRRDLQGAIVFIPSADPGYDWIFASGLSGLVTMYGGANSHMAIRAGELGIPSVIGAGEVLYKKWLEASLLQLDCLNCQVLVVKQD